jgi:hypothetical protein
MQSTCSPKRSSSVVFRPLNLECADTDKDYEPELMSFAMILPLRDIKISRIVANRSVKDNAATGE